MALWLSLFIGWITPGWASLSEWISPKVFEITAGSPSLDLEVQQDGEKIAKYGVNNGGRFGLGLANDLYGVRVSTYQPPEPESRALKGETKYTDYQFRFNLFQHHSVEFIHQAYTGYYLSESSQNGLDVIRPDIRTAVNKIQYIYVTDSKSLNLDALLNRVDYKSKSGGSWFLEGGVGTYFLQADSPLANVGVANELGDLIKLSAINVEAGGGYGYHYVAAPFFIGGLFRLSLGFQDKDLSFQSGDDRKDRGNSLNSGAVITTGLDYPGWFTSLSLSAKSTQFRFDGESNLSFSTVSALLLVGIRI